MRESEEVQKFYGRSRFISSKNSWAYLEREEALRCATTGRAQRDVNIGCLAAFMNLNMYEKY